MGVGNILIKRLSDDQHIISTLFWTSLMTLPLALAFALPQWAEIEWRHVGWIMAINLFVLGYHALVVVAYKKRQQVRLHLPSIQVGVCHAIRRDVV
ncbi:metabolite transporter (DMT) superfamily [Vibrio astriarenae]|nr:metabolite transporter (DMT) superfamily [Vibrio sp. C7]